MHSFIEFLQRGGLIMIPMIALSVLLYERCFSLLMLIHQSKRSLDLSKLGRDDSLLLVRDLRTHLRETFKQNKFVIAAMITAAPLLGLLGTVTGMGVTFNHLAAGVGNRSMDGLSSGISEALIATETGLGIAIPALVVTYFAQRQLDKVIFRLSHLERTLLET